MNQVKVIAIVDDNVDDLLIMQDALRSYDPSFKCRLFHAPEDVIEALIDEKFLLPDYIFIDINMPRINGVTLLRMLREHPHLNEMTTIIFSTYISDDERQILGRKGADFAFTKPSSTHSYHKILSSVFESVPVFKQVDERRR